MGGGIPIPASAAFGAFHAVGNVIGGGGPPPSGGPPGAPQGPPSITGSSIVPTITAAPHHEGPPQLRHGSPHSPPTIITERPSAFGGGGVLGLVPSAFKPIDAVMAHISDSPSSSAALTTSISITDAPEPTLAIRQAPDAAEATPSLNALYILSQALDHNGQPVAPSDVAAAGPDNTFTTHIVTVTVLPVNHTSTSPVHEHADHPTSRIAQKQPDHTTTNQHVQIPTQPAVHHVAPSPSGPAIPAKDSDESGASAVRGSVYWGSVGLAALMGSLAYFL